VQTADRLYTDLPAIHHQIWVTEWGWVTNPPDKSVGDSPGVAARYVAYSMYEMWKNRVSLVIWQVVDDFAEATPDGRGLYTNQGKPKVTVSAFGFPVVASVSGNGGFAWGRVPISRRVAVRVQRQAGRRWTNVTTTVTGSDGVFYVRIRAHGNGLYRAQVVGGPTSLPYDSRPIPPRRTHLFNTG
jgi:hypothetical protein